ncbi:MAG: DUF4278 domain-containing protein [Cyanobacteria bacterium J06638_22]
MKLNYRGTAYEANTPVVGLNNSNLADAELKYRGNSYVTNQPVAAQQVEAATPLTETVSAPVAATFNDRARLLMMSHHRQVKHRQQVMLARVATSIGLDATEAAGYWGHIQGKVQPSFWNTYDRSRSASS